MSKTQGHADQKERGCLIPQVPQDTPLSHSIWSSATYDVSAPDPSRSQTLALPFD